MHVTWFGLTLCGMQVERVQAMAAKWRAEVETLQAAQLEVSSQARLVK